MPPKEIKDKDPFDLERAIARWKKELRKRQAFEDGDIVELEGHLRDKIEDLAGRTPSKEAAFRQAASEFTTLEELDADYFRARSTSRFKNRPTWQPPRLVPALLWNYFKIASRKIGRQKAYSFINITGLAIGMAAFLMIFLYVNSELNFDRHQENFDKIYRINKTGRMRNSDYELAITPSALASAVGDEILEAEAVTRILPKRDAVLRYKDKAFIERGVLSVDPGFLKIFTTPFIQGDSEAALSEPYSVVVTESAARKYFGETNPLGRYLNLNHETDFLITGIVKDVPATSHFHYDFLLSMDPARPQRWLGNSDYTYVMLKDNTNITLIDEKLKSLCEKYVYPLMESRLDRSIDSMKRNGDFVGFKLQPLKHIHFGTQVVHQMEPPMDRTYIHLFSLIAAAIILIACINFTNLASARSVLRAREVGVRKVLGSSRQQIMRQFLGETLIMSVLAMSAALILLTIFLPAFNLTANRSIELNTLFTGSGILLLLSLTGLSGLLAGLYPAFFLSSFKPVKVLKSTLEIRGKKSFVRNGLVIFQFVVTIILISSTLIINRQMNYLNRKNLGFNREALLIVKNCQSVKGIDPLVLELERRPGILSVSNSSSIPGSGMGDRGYWIDGNEDNLILHRNFYADEKFISTYEIDMTYGRYFNKEFPSDSSSVVINQTAAAELGVENPVGRILSYKDASTGEIIRLNIIGVMHDFHMRSLHEKISPVVIYLKPQNYRARYLSLRIDTGDLPGVMAATRNLWKRFAADQPIEYSFFNDEFNKHYAAEMKTWRLFTIFTLLALFIACLGLFGLTSFTTSLRMKEIGIRKVLGAKPDHLFKLLVGDIFRLVFISIGLGWPVAFIFIKNWLQRFAYRTHMPYEAFPAAACIAISAALLTVSYHAVKASMLNPIKTLRQE